jgi:Na+/H+-dicarboxylate symporter
MAAASMPLFSLNFGKSAVGSGFSSLYQMVLNIIPVNLVMPFAEGNTLQILFIGVITGVALLLIGKKTEQVAELSEQLGLITNGIMNVIGRLVPFFVFGSLLNVIASSDLDTLAVGGKFFYSTIICCTLILAMHTGLTVYRTKLSPITLWKKTLSTFVIAVTTASSAAAFSDNLNTCINKLGISEKFADFGVPFGQILYKPGFTAVYWCAAISEAEYCGIEISGSWLIIALFMCIVLSAATPTIPGGGTASFSILFAQLGLPLDDLGVIISLNIILDFYYTAVNLFSSQCILLNTATQLHMVRHADAAGESRE